MNARSLSVFLLGFLILVAVAAPAAFVFAQTGSDGGFSGPIVPCDGTVGADGTGRPCNFCTLATLIQNIINFGIYLSVLAGGAMFAYAGFLYLTNRGIDQRIKDAHKIFTQVLIGLLIILSAWLLIDVIMKSLVKDSGGFGPWNEICGARTDAAGRVLGPN